MENKESVISPYLQIAFLLYCHSFGRIPALYFDISRTNNYIQIIQRQATPFKKFMWNIVFIILSTLYCCGCVAVLISKILHLRDSNKITILQIVLMLVHLFGIILLVASEYLLMKNRDVIPFINQFINCGLRLGKF